MTDLAALFLQLGFDDAETYIQSGNVIFGCLDEITVNDVSSKIEKAIHGIFNYEIPVMVRTVEEMKKLLVINPFVNETTFDPSKMAVIFLQNEPLEIQIRNVLNIDFPPDKFKIIGREIFIYCPNGFGKTKLYTNFFEMKMGVIGTARNWKTINKLLELAEKKS